MNKQDKIRKSFISLLLAVYALSLPHFVWAQQSQVHGVVRDASSGQPLEGVTVRSGDRALTSTDANGAFSVNNVGQGATLVFTLIGYAEQSAKAAANMTVSLQSSSISELDEVVVVGYGTQKKATLTGAIEVVGKEAFENRAITNVALALQGQTPGLVVTRSSPRPGNEGIGLAIRGASSVNGGSPLIVIDGVPAINNYAFQNLNPDDIENVTVLKDGSAAIYGSRAANGVILVTTKQGKGAVRVDYTGNFRFNTNGLVGYSPSMQEYAAMWIEANKEEAAPNWWIWGEDNVHKMAAGHEGLYDLFNTDFYVYNANRIEEMFATRYSYQHNLSLAGGTEKSGYRISLGYADNQGNLATAYDGQKQYNLRLNHNYQVSDRFKLESSISIINANTDQPSRGLGNILYSFDMPFYPAKNPLGQWLAPFNGIDGGAIRNAAATTSDAGRYEKKSLTGRADLRATYDIWNGISIEGLASLQNERFTHETYVVPVQLYDWYGNPTNYAHQTDGTNNMFGVSAYTSFNQYYEALLRYNKTFATRHNIQAMAGINAEKFHSQNITASRVGFEDRGVYDISRADAETQTNGGGQALNGRYSYISRLNYNYDEKYLLELIGRVDGNSRFANGYKFRNFGSVQAGWVFTKENFMSSLSNVLSFGKIRASYASTGNQEGLTEFEYISRVNTGTAVLGNPASLQTSSTLFNLGMISLTRTWETVVQKNIGIDLNFLNNRLTTSFDAYEKKNIGMLVGVTYPSVLGANPPQTNSGNFNTRGWEAVVSWKDRKGDFAYNVSVNMGDANTLVYGVENADSFRAGRNNVVNGFPHQSWFLYKTDGFFKDQADVDAYYAAYGGSETLANLVPTNPQQTLRPGDTKRIDVAGTGNITALGNGESSLVYMGDGRPHFTYGFNLGGAWKGIDMNMFFQGHLKQNIMRDGYMAYPFRALYTNQNPAFLGRTWTEENPNAEFPRLTVNPNRAAWNYANNDFMLQNSRYIRLKTLVLGYTLPTQVTDRAKLSRVRVYFSGNDLWEATAIKDGFDPETGQNSTDGDNAGYPFARTWSFGVNIGF